MAHDLDPRQVLAYLNELGYKNITAQQLKEFMIDLKILMKYDTRQLYEEDTVDSTRQSTRNVFEELYTKGTVASKAKTSRPSRREKVITVEVHRPNSRTTPPQITPAPSQITSAPSQITSAPNQTSAQSQIVPPIVLPESSAASGSNVCKCMRSEGSGSEGQSKTGTARTKGQSSAGPNSRRDEKKKKQKENRPKASFIRPRLNTKPAKSDPVARHQWYQEEWKRQKIPGTDNHADLRWVIRERMLGENNDYFY